MSDSFASRMADCISAYEYHTVGLVGSKTQLSNILGVVLLLYGTL